MDEPVTPFVSLHTAASLSGVSIRTLWRRIANGELRTRKESGPSARTLIALDDLQAQMRVLLVAGDVDMVCAADAGDPEAQCELGLAFLLAGHAEEAVSWFKASAERFCPDALYQLARCHLTGVGAVRDDALGRQLMARAAARGHLIASALSQYLDDPARPALGSMALESELDSIERRVVLETLNETAKAHR